MRALAVLIVVFSHAGLERWVPGSTGVTIFFVISGFIITNLLIRERNATGSFNLGQFYFRRAFKLMPPFLLVVAIPTLLYATFQSINWFHFSSQVFFFFNLIYMSGNTVEVLPGSTVVWSLSIEEQFYLVFSALWLFLAARAYWRTALLYGTLLVVIVALVLRWMYVGQSAVDVRILYGTETRMDSIGIGILAAIIFSRATENLLPRTCAVLKSNWTVVLAAVLFIASIVFRDDLYKLVLRPTFESAATALLLLYGLLRTSGKLRRFLGRLSNLKVVSVVGLSSYSIYLVHLTLIKSLAPFMTSLPDQVRVACLIAISIAAGVVLWAVVERPALSLRNRLERRTTSQLNDLELAK
jgi:peptidoglycan/LPS O-acetylase OafA/YrhL